MTRFIGLLTINGVSRLDGTRLAREPLTGDPFGPATNFLMAEPRSLRNGHRIWVEGRADTIGNTRVIVVADAGRALPAVVTAGGTLRAGAEVAPKNAAGGVPADETAGAGAATKSGSGKAGAKRPAGKSAAKKSGTGRTSKRRTAQKSGRK